MIAGILPADLGDRRRGGHQPGPSGADGGGQPVEHDVDPGHHDRSGRRDRLLAVRSQPPPPAAGRGHGACGVDRPGRGHLGLCRVLRRHDRAHRPGRAQHRQHPVPHRDGARRRRRGRGGGAGGHHPDAGDARLRRDASALEPVGPPQGREGGHPRLRTAVAAVRDDAQASPDPVVLVGIIVALGGRDAVPAHASRLARRGIAAHESDHPACLRPDLGRASVPVPTARFWSWSTPPAASPRGRSRHSRRSTQQKAHLPPDVASIGPPIPNPAGERLPGRGHPEDRSERSGDDTTHRQHPHRRGPRQEEVRTGHLRDRPDRAQRRHLGQALVGAARCISA